LGSAAESPPANSGPHGFTSTIKWEFTRAAIDGAEGVLNATAPHPVTNANFTNALAVSLHRPAFLPIPAFALKLVFGEGALMMTEGQKVLPIRTREVGYTFKYPHIDAAMKDAVVVR
jgi:NAD dependent epimerase/dehydratase family enzyme